MFLKIRHLFKHNNNKANPKAMLHLLTTKNNVPVRGRTVVTKLLVVVLLIGCSFVAQSQCSTPSGNQTTYGSGSWIGYVYNTINTSNPPTNAFTTNYKGYITQPEIFNQDLGSGALSGANLCGNYSDEFAIRFKMAKNFAPGNYSFQVSGDDGYRLSFDGGVTFPISKWNNKSTTTATGTYYLSGTINLVLEYYEHGGISKVSFNYTACTHLSTAPTAITGATSLCGSGSTILTASGGTLGSNGSYQWGTGAVGTNIIAGQTAATITVNVPSTKTYWVRRVDNTCSNTTSEVSQVVTVYSTTVAGSLSSKTTTICANNTPSDIILSGNIGAVVKWQSASNSTFTSGLTDIASTSTTLTGAMMGTISATTYYRAVVQNGNCNLKNTTGIKITVPEAVTYNGSWSGTPNATTPVTISGNLTLTSDLNVCSCQVTGTAVITVPANKTLVVQKNISIASTASIVIENDGSLLQVDDNASTVGNITFKRNTTPLKQYDYTYWSSPLAGQTLNILGGPSFFYSFNPTINNWVYEVGTNTMTAAKGYIARAPNNLDFSTPQVVATTFNGTPNNGVINTPIKKMDGVTYNLIGNPYPSAIDIDAFLLDPTNSNIVNGTIYMWTHNTAISNSILGNQAYNYTRDDYAKYNLTGGVKTSREQAGGVTPTGKIAAGQGFFIEANSALTTGSYQATFKNYMRISGNNNQLFKFSNYLNNPTTQSEVVHNTIEKNRIWLSVSNTDGAYDEALVGYITGATNNLDNLYDGKTIMGGNVVSLYSTLNTTDLSIQGKALPFIDSDIVPLGFRTTISGNFTIRLENFDGLFENQNVYLFDKTTLTYCDLKAQSYTFNLASSGTYNDRFELRYTNGALANNTFDIDNNGIQIIRKDKYVAVKSTSTINKIEVVDLLGKSMYSKSKINANEFNTSDLSMSSEIVIVKVTLENDMTISRKVIMN